MKTFDKIRNMIVVLTILGAQNDINIESCIDYAYEEIKDRTGSMINGVFVKDT